MLKTECQRCKYRQAGWYLSKTLQLVQVVIQVLYTALSFLCLAFYNINCICKIGGSLINYLLSMVFVKEKKRHADSGDCYCATTEAEHWTVLQLLQLENKSFTTRILCYALMGENKCLLLLQFFGWSLASFRDSACSTLGWLCLLWLSIFLLISEKKASACWIWCQSKAAYL